MQKQATPLKLFISYSHKDEVFCDEFKTHLAPLKSNGTIEAWHDRQLKAGDCLDEELASHLKQSTLVAFLISSDFLDSFYCMQKEWSQALNQRNAGVSTIIPIIVRECSWEDTDFKKYVCIPNEGRAIKSFEDQDKGWKEVVSHIKTVIDGLENSIPTVQLAAQEPTPEWKEFLDSTEVTFEHKYKERVLLNDIFVYPDLKNVKEDYNKIRSTFSSSVITGNSVKYQLILGSEQSGKTSLAKTLITTSLDQDKLAIYIDASTVGSTNIKKLIQTALQSQYGISNVDIHPNQVDAIIDNYDQIKLNLSHQPKFVDSVSQHFDRVFIFSNKSLKYDEPRFSILAAYDAYEILPFGNVKRDELIQRWVSMGQTETISEVDLQQKSDFYVKHIDGIIRKNIIPPKPIYILTILQLLDTGRQSDFTLTSYGYCYQTLIQQALSKEKVKMSQFDFFDNYLSELAYFIFKSGGNFLTTDQLTDFDSQYSSRYLHDASSHEATRGTLVKARILNISSAGVSFSYRYIYYYYAAKHLAAYIKDCMDDVETLCNNLHTEKNANIVIFLVHHSKDPAILDEIILNSLAVFEQMTPATLNKKETDYLLEFINVIPKLVCEKRSVSSERQRRLKEKDRLDRSIEDEDNYMVPKSDDSDTFQKDDTLAEINRSARIVEVIGQILRNRHSSLTKDQLIDLTESAINSGLKFLNFYLTTLREDKDEILCVLEYIIKENSELSDDKISKVARNLYLSLSYGVSFAVIKKLAASLGSREIYTIFDRIKEKNEQNPALDMLYIAVKLEVSDKLPKKELEGLFRSLESNPISRRLLQEIVVQHLYLNFVPLDEKQWVSEALHIPMGVQRSLQFNKLHKTR